MKSTPQQVRIDKQALRQQARRRFDQIREGSRTDTGRRLKIGALIFLLVILAAFWADLRGVRTHLINTQSAPSRGSVADIEAGMNGPRYMDPQGRFSLVPPAFWRAQPQPKDSQATIIFWGPDRTELAIQVDPLKPGEEVSFEQLRARIQTIERRLSSNMHIEEIDFQGHRAISRTFRMYTQTLYVVDFIHQGWAHNLTLSVAPEFFETYLPVIKRVLATYTPGPNPPAARPSGTR